MLFLSSITNTVERGQGTYLSDDEISRVIGAVATSEPQFVKELIQLKTSLPDGDKKKFSDRDELYESAIDIVVREGRGSVSLLQRSLGIGYGRGARLIDFMAEDGIVGPYNGSQAREILITLAQWEEMSGQGSAESIAADPPKPQRNKKILMAPPAEQRMSAGTVCNVKPVDDFEEDVEQDYDEIKGEPPFDADETDEKDEELEEEEEELGDEEGIEEEEKESPSLSPRSKGRWKAESA
jgi:S-DNA-T family DNA segregation ATPase FtsK/SpoIIIE